MLAQHFLGFEGEPVPAPAVDEQQRWARAERVDALQRSACLVAGDLGIMVDVKVDDAFGKELDTSVGPVEERRGMTVD